MLGYQTELRSSRTLKALYGTRAGKSAEGQNPKHRSRKKCEDVRRLLRCRGCLSNNPTVCSHTTTAAGLPPASMSAVSSAFANRYSKMPCTPKQLRHKLTAWPSVKDQQIDAWSHRRRLATILPLLPNHHHAHTTPLPCRPPQQSCGERDDQGSKACFLRRVCVSPRLNAPGGFCNLCLQGVVLRQQLLQLHHHLSKAGPGHRVSLPALLSQSGVRLQKNQAATAATNTHTYVLVGIRKKSDFGGYNDTDSSKYPLAAAESGAF